MTNIEKAAIADTALNNLAELKQAKKKENGEEENVEQLSRIHDSLGQAFPKKLKKELNLKGF